jgi:hypothetical protein
MSTPGEKIGIAVADNLGDSPSVEVRDAKRHVWKLICSALARHFPAWEETLINPSAGLGLDRPRPALATEVDAHGEFVHLWWRSGPLPTDWIRLDSVDDHLVLATATDATPPGAVADKLAVENGLTVRTATVGGVQKVIVGGPSVPAADDHLVIAVTGDKPGVLAVKHQARYPLLETIEGDAGDQHVMITLADVPPPPDPETYASAVYTAVFADPKDKLRVRAIVNHGASYGFGPSESQVWELAPEYGPYAWRGIAAGPMFLWNHPELKFNKGDRGLVYQSGTSGEAKYFGAYDILDPGWYPVTDEGGTTFFRNTRPVIRRCPDADSSSEVVTGTFWLITEGDLAGKFAVVNHSGTLTIDETNPELVIVDDRTSVPTWPLVTAKQLAGCVQGNADAVALPTAAEPKYFAGLGPRYEMRPDTLTSGELPAGDWELQIACKVSALTDAASGDIPADTIIRSEVGIADYSGMPTFTPIFTVDSEPIKAIGSHAVIAVKAPNQLAQSLGPMQWLYWVPQARTTSVGTIAVTLLVNSDNHLTRIRTPITFSTTGGTNDHPSLIRRNDAHQHLESAVDAEPMADATYSSVIIVPPKAANGLVRTGFRFRYAGGGGFNGIDPTGFVAGQAVCVFFDVHAGEVLALAENQSPPGGYSEPTRFLLKNSPSGGRLLKAPTFITFRLDTWSATPGWRET